ncbi:iron-containing alcohol dehydrogenase [uncultured Duncaniella sp.]|uniref:iron-containing alcohol dehydrogenase n=1 Tax=uncultured Duncaniella sp. TaxID=2768039 RepID=UPI0025A9B1FB|nr:iron-containing alcohol dehydrogenase [uncultured Duncaniella sp.]
MDNFSFCTPTRYVFGHEAECKAATLCHEAGWKHVMIVYGGQSAIRSGLLDRVRKSLGDTGITVIIGKTKCTFLEKRNVYRLYIFSIKKD